MNTMTHHSPEPIRLADYRPYPFTLDKVELDFDLAPETTRVKAALSFTRKVGLAEGDNAPLVLDGIRLNLISVTLDGVILTPDRYQLDAETLTVFATPNSFVLETEVEIAPGKNTALEGLYMSGGRYCSQCEAEGFRKITYFPDRPDVLSRFTVRITAPKAFEHLLSNGNLIEQGALPGDRHFAVWSDPFPKPCYLFALVAGRLDVLDDSFTTMTGRQIALRIFVDPGQSARAAYAMDSLKRSMTWDEEVFGREYDLDLFMIVAVRDFNFGAMENKGLNVFNSSLLLADEETATDADFERIESVVAHEYFHNWTGNRITCRDWFQLCLKEGLTVFRDQSFSGDMRGEAVQRIKDVKMLRARQFPEDGGPMAHPVRPSSYVKIDNFYTATIYEKGSELIRMLKTLIGADAFRRGMDLYFERWDGHATTVEAFIECFTEASGQDLAGFFNWYEQAGTPTLRLSHAYDEASGALDLTLSQSLAPTPGQPEKSAVPIPVRLGFLDAQGSQLSARHGNGAAAEHLVVLDKAQTTLRFEGLSAPPVISALRGFSAPVKLVTDAAPHDAYVLMAADPDLFNRWEAGQALARDLILGRAAGAADELGEERFAEAMGRALFDEAADHAFKALMLGLPTEADLALSVTGPVDPAAIHDARETLRTRIAAHLSGQFLSLHLQLQLSQPFSPDARQAGQRALRNAVLDALTALPSSEVVARANDHFRLARNMTDQMGGLSALMMLGGDGFDQALSAFYAQWKAEPLVIDKWFGIQARAPSEDVLGRILGLTAHPDFDPRNPNRLRALVMGFSVGNPWRFHSPDGAGYRFLGDQIIGMDAINPMVAARLVEPLSGWARYAPGLGDQMKAELARIMAHPGLSKNVGELADKALGG
jgi:aminopeptidase N